MPKQDEVGELQVPQALLSSKVITGASEHCKVDKVVSKNAL